MVCIPCIILPVALWIYYKFLQPYVLKLVPERWRTWADSIMYPTCPVKAPPPATEEPRDESEESQRSKLEQEAIVTNGEVVSDKKTD